MLPPIAINKQIFLNFLRLANCHVLLQTLHYQQEQSYVVGDAIYCVYNAVSEELIKEHSERSGAPATEISEVTSVIRHNTSFVS